MKKAFVVPLLAASLLYAGALAACSPSSADTASKGAEPSASQTVFVSASPDNGFQPGGKPYSGINADNISSIRMTVYKDQPPEMPDPCKDIVNRDDLAKLANMLRRITILKGMPQEEFPTGATGYTLLLTLKDGSSVSVDLYEQDILSRANAYYKVSGLPKLDELFDSLGTLSPGDKPYSTLKAENIARIRMIVYSDAQPPDWPDPYKDISNTDDLQNLTGILNRITVQKKVSATDRPVGLTGYSLVVSMKDGATLTIYIYGRSILIESGAVYQISTVGDLNRVFDELPGKPKMTGGTSAPGQTGK